VNFVENHDQVANSLQGLRSHQRASPGRHRVVTALFLLLPQTPMLFQGQEFAASSPFLYFADHRTDLAKEVRAGRAGFLAQFASMTSEEAANQLDDPGDPATFDRCKLDWTERDASGGAHAEALALVRDLLRLRRDDPAIRAQNGLAQGSAEGPRHPLDGAVIGGDALILRFFGAREEDDRLLVLNLGREQRPGSLAEPLAAPPLGMLWRTMWYSEHPRYGGAGGGASGLDTNDGGWWLPGEAAILLAAVPREDAEPAARPPRSQREARGQWESRP
jgi:maltooligosyltrehalose trehalohydrolase